MSEIIDSLRKAEFATGQHAQIHQAIASPRERMENIAIHVENGVITAGHGRRDGSISATHDRSRNVDDVAFGRLTVYTADGTAKCAQVNELIVMA